MCRPYRAWLSAAFVVFFSGCAARGPQAYRLIPDGRVRTLVPPGVKGRESRATIVATVRAWWPGCAPESDAIAVRGRKTQVRLTVNAGALAQKPAGWLAEWLAAAEAQGCLTGRESSDLATRILEAAPLDPAAAYRLLHDGTIQKGYIDLGAETRLQVVTPIMKAGAAPDAPILETVGVSGSGNQLNVAVRSAENLTGIETAWYGFQPRPGEDGWKIAPLAVEHRIQGRLEAAAAALTNYFVFSAAAAHYRLFYKTDPTDNGITEIILAAPTRAELEKRTRALATDSSLCTKTDPDFCVVIPRRVAVNPFVAVTINGTEALLPVGSTVRRAIQTVDARANVPEIVPRLQLLKPHRGKLTPVEFDRRGQEVLDVTLLGGESMSW
jgi:hypothetical protein